jgi:hypothetical protein
VKPRVKIAPGNDAPSEAILCTMRDDDYGADENHEMDAGAEAYVPPEIVFLGTLFEMTEGPVGSGDDVDIPGNI